MTGKEVKEKRLGLGLTQPRLGAYLGVSWWTIAQWEQGRRVPSMDEFSLRHAFGAAARAQAAGLPLPDWRTMTVVGGPVEEPARLAAPQAEGESE